MTYAQLARRATALACFLGPTLIILGVILYVARPGSPGLFADEAAINLWANNVELMTLSYFGHILLIPAFFGLTALVGQRMPRLAITAAAMGLLGLAAIISFAYQGLNIASAARNGAAISWDIFTQNGVTAAQLAAGLVHLLYHLAKIVLGVGILRTGVLPRWAGGLLILAGVLHFDSQGPGMLGVRVLTLLLTGLCLLAVYAVVGGRLWRGDEATTPARQAVGMA
jgi:hypothetical protein